MVSNHSDAEDVLQNSFLDVFTRLDSFRFESSIGAWIKRIVINNCINFLNKRRIRFDELDEHHIEIEEEGLIKRKIQSSYFCHYNSGKLTIIPEPDYKSPELKKKQRL
jgi:DNA-directed RNA polymerase specialized sigma24 family protein